jgi:hypothetical protein
VKIQRSFFAEADLFALHQHHDDGAGRGISAVDLDLGASVGDRLKPRPVLVQIAAGLMVQGDLLAPTRPRVVWLVDGIERLVQEPAERESPAAYFLQEQEI